MNEQRWEKLEVWQLSDSLAHEIYLATKKFPKEEVHGVSSQLRRAALSIPTNIVKGCSRRGDKEMARSVNNCLGTLAETGYLLGVAQRLGYISDEHRDSLEKKCTILGKKLWRFYDRL